MISVVNKRKGYVEQPGDVYVGRPSPWGNPYEIRKRGTRDQVIARYAEWLADRPRLIEALAAKNPQRLVCWCAPLPCHADVLAKALVDRDR